MSGQNVAGEDDDYPGRRLLAIENTFHIGTSIQLFAICTSLDTCLELTYPAEAPS